MTTCARCGTELGDASACPQCGQQVLSPQSSAQSAWRTDTAERPAVRAPVEPASAPTPGPARYPLYADEEEVEDHQAAAEVLPPAPPPAYVEDAEYDEEDDRGAPPWLPWVVLLLVMVLVAVGGVWLLLSGDGGSATDTAPPPVVSSKIGANQSPTPRSTAPETSAAASDTPSSSAPAGDPVEVATSARASAPRSAPPNEDAFGNRTTYDAGNLVDGSPSTCWRTAGDASGLSLTFALAQPTTLTRVGLINGYAKNALVGNRKLDWYAGNRRVLAVQWVLDDGTTIDQQLGTTKKMQTIALESPVETSSVTLRLVSVSAPGTGRSARDYTAVSEVSLLGTPVG